MKTMTGMHCKETPSTKTASVLTTLLFVYFGKSFTRCLSSKRKISSSFLPAQIVYPSWEWRLSEYVFVFIHFFFFSDFSNSFLWFFFEKVNHPENSWWRLLFACRSHMFQSVRPSVVQHQGKASLQVASSYPTDSRFRPSLINFDVTIAVTLNWSHIVFKKFLWKFLYICLFVDAPLFSIENVETCKIIQFCHHVLDLQIGQFENKTKKCEGTLVREESELIKAVTKEVG